MSDNVHTLLQVYAGVFQNLLAALVQPESSPQNNFVLERIHNLVDELCCLQIGTCAVVPEVFTRFQHMNLAGEEQEKPPEGHWAHVVVSNHTRFSHRRVSISRIALLDN